MQMIEIIQRLLTSRVSKKLSPSSLLRFLISITLHAYDSHLETRIYTSHHQELSKTKTKTKKK